MFETVFRLQPEHDRNFWAQRRSRLAPAAPQLKLGRCGVHPARRALPPSPRVPAAPPPSPSQPNKSLRPPPHPARLPAWCCFVNRVLRHASRTASSSVFDPPRSPPRRPTTPIITMAPAAFITPVAATTTRSSASAFAAGGVRVGGRPAAAASVLPVVAAGGRLGRAARQLAMKVTIEESPLPNSMRGVTIHVSADEVALCYNKVRTAGLLGGEGGGGAGELEGQGRERDLGRAGAWCSRCRHGREYHVELGR